MGGRVEDPGSPIGASSRAALGSTGGPAGESRLWETVRDGVRGSESALSAHGPSPCAAMGPNRSSAPTSRSAFSSPAVSPQLKGSVLKMQVQSGSGCQPENGQSSPGRRCHLAGGDNAPPSNLVHACPIFALDCEPPGLRRPKPLPAVLGVPLVDGGPINILVARLLLDDRGLSVWLGFPEHQEVFGARYLPALPTRPGVSLGLGTNMCANSF
jgi:hypothetical protein